MPQASQIDPNIYLTIGVIAATFLGPFFAVLSTKFIEFLREKKNRKIEIFKTLIATRMATMAFSHIEAINLVLFEFNGKSKKEKTVIDNWQCYIAHLGDKDYPAELWNSKRNDLLSSLLLSIAKSLNMDFEKNKLERGAYYPQGHIDTENEQNATRKLLLEILSGKREFPMTGAIKIIEDIPQAKSSQDLKAQ